MRLSKTFAASVVLVLLGAGCAKQPPAVVMPPADQNAPRTVMVDGLIFALSKPEWKVVAQDARAAQIQVPSSQVKAGESLRLELAVESVRPEEIAEFTAEKPYGEKGNVKLWEAEYSGECALGSFFLMVNQRAYAASWTANTYPPREHAEEDALPCPENLDLPSGLPEMLLSAQAAPSKTLVLQGLTFTLPTAEWGIASHDDQDAEIAVSSSAPAARVRLNIARSDKKTWKEAAEVAAKAGNRLSGIACDGGHSNLCYGLETPAGAYLVTAFFDIAPPAEGSPAPDFDLVEGDLASMLVTAAAAK